MRKVAVSSFTANLFILLLCISSISSHAQETKRIKCAETDDDCQFLEYARLVSLECRHKNYASGCNIVQWTKIIESNSNSAAYYGRGLYFSSAERDLAIQDFKKAIELNPTYFRAYYELGIRYLFNKEYDRAINEFTNALEAAIKEPKETSKKRERNIQNAYAMRGATYFQKGDFPKAFAEYNKVIELYPKNAGGYLGLADVYAAQGDKEKALENFNKAIELAPNNFVVFHIRGNFYLKIGEKEKGEADLKKSKLLRAVVFN